MRTCTGPGAGRPLAHLRRGSQRRRILRADGLPAHPTQHVRRRPRARAARATGAPMPAPRRGLCAPPPPRPVGRRARARARRARGARRRCRLVGVAPLGRQVWAHPPRRPERTRRRQRRQHGVGRAAPVDQVPRHGRRRRCGRRAGRARCCGPLVAQRARALRWWW